MSRPGNGGDRGQESPGEERQEVGGQQSSRRDPPHPTVNDAQAGQIQRESPSPRTVPAMPANASGTDRVSTEDQDQGIDPASMYDRRPGEDKDRPETDMP
jgi:hypothetical protein